MLRNPSAAAAAHAAGCLDTVIDAMRAAAPAAVGGCGFPERDVEPQWVMRQVFYPRIA